MKHRKTVCKNICIGICLLLVTILLLQVLRIYYQFEDKNLIGNIEESAYDIEVGENSLSFAQKIEALNSEEAIILEQDEEELYYSETEFNEFSKKLEYQIRQLVVSPWREIILEKVLNSNDKLFYGHEAQIFYEINNKMYTFEVVEFDIPSANGTFNVLFEKDTCEIFYIEAHSQLELDESAFNQKYYAFDFYMEQENYIRAYYDNCIDYEKIMWSSDSYGFYINTIINSEFFFNKEYDNIIIDSEKD